MANANLPDDIPVLTAPAAKRLNQRQQLDYTNHRETPLQWLLHLGKDPHNATGYSASTVKRDAYRIDQFYRWVWETEDGYTTAVSTPTPTTPARLNFRPRDPVCGLSRLPGRRLP